MISKNIVLIAYCLKMRWSSVLGQGGLLLWVKVVFDAGQAVLCSGVSLFSVPVSLSSLFRCLSALGFFEVFSPFGDGVREAWCSEFWVVA